MNEPQPPAFPPAAAPAASFRLGYWTRILIAVIVGFRVVVLAFAFFHPKIGPQAFFELCGYFCGQLLLSFVVAYLLGWLAYRLVMRSRLVGNLVFCVLFLGVTCLSSAGGMAAKQQSIATASSTASATSYTLVLREAGDNQIQVIALVRAARSDLGLAEAKALVDAAPTPLLTDVSRKEAQKWKMDLQAVGATASVEPFAPASNPAPGN